MTRNDCMCRRPGFSLMGCLQDPTDGSLDESVSLFLSGEPGKLEVATNTAGFIIFIKYCPFCGRELKTNKE